MSKKVYEETIQSVREQFPNESEEWVREVASGIYGMVEIIYEKWLCRTKRRSGIVRKTNASAVRLVRVAWGLRLVFAHK